MVGVPMTEQWLEFKNGTRRFVLWPCELLNPALSTESTG